RPQGRYSTAPPQRIPRPNSPGRFFHKWRNENMTDKTVRLFHPLKAGATTEHGQFQCDENGFVDVPEAAVKLLCETFGFQQECSAKPQLAAPTPAELSSALAERDAARAELEAVRADLVKAQDAAAKGKGGK